MHRSPAQTGPGVIVEMQVIKKRKKYSAGSGDTASMIKGGGYFGARTRQVRLQHTIDQFALTSAAAEAGQVKI